MDDVPFSSSISGSLAGSLSDSSLAATSGSLELFSSSSLDIVGGLIMTVLAIEIL